jgi:hypothetical protein
MAVTAPPRASAAAAGQARAVSASAERRRSGAVLVLLAVTAGAAVLLRGGYFAAGRAVFVLLAGAALLAAVVLDDGAALRFLRSPIVAVMAALGVLAGLSAAWTMGDPGEAISTAMMLLALAAVVVTAGVVASHQSSERIALVLVLLAAVAAAAGLLGVVLREDPWAQRIGGSWRPGGPFEYPPALALLQVAALPALLRWMVRSTAAPAAAAVLGGALAASTLALSESRVHLALAGLVAVIAVAWPRATVGGPRAVALAAVALLAAAGAAADAVAGGYVRPLATGGDAGRLLGLLAIAVGAAAAWTVVRATLRNPRRTWPAGGTPAASRRPLLGLALGGAAVVVAAVLAASPAVVGSGGFTHGRLALWGHAVATGLDRPVLGAGADGFLAASADRQGDSPTRYAHNLPLELAVELGIAGLILSLALYATMATALIRARGSPALWLLGPAVGAFLVANLVDWPWHLAGCGAICALALGALLAATPSPR